eukprot:3940978-Rhodomonas_salina.1
MLLRDVRYSHFVCCYRSGTDMRCRGTDTQFRISAGHGLVWRNGGGTDNLYCAAAATASLRRFKESKRPPRPPAA